MHVLLSSSLMDTDYLLNLEEKYYQEGFEEGINEKARHNFYEGKQYGLQVGFQRFVLLGQIEGLLDIFETIKIPGNSFSKNIEAIRNFAAGLKMDNEDANVAEYENRLVKIRNKLRTILLLMQKRSGKAINSPLTLEDIEEVSMDIAGELKGYVDTKEGQDELVVQNQSQDW